MADTRLTLGSFVFRDFEIPSKIAFGGKQSLHIHKRVGGDRTIDCMGPDPSDIHWDGRLRGTAAASRARALDRMRAAGAAVPVVWGSFFYFVVVSEFEAEYEKFYEIPYKITLTVVTDPSAGVGGAIGPLLSLISADLGSLVSLGGAL